MAPTVRSLGNARLNMLNKPRALTTRPEFVADIHREWSNALEATVAVGRRLNEAKAALPHGEYEAMVESDLPFSSATARKLRKAAELVDSGQIDLEKLPESYTTLYAIATLPDEARQQAIDQGVIRPDVTRAELVAYKAPKEAPRREDDLFAAPEIPAVASEPPDPLLIRLRNTLAMRGLIGPDKITLQHPVADEQLELVKQGSFYVTRIHYINGCGYAYSEMSKTRVDAFLRAWLNTDAPGAPPSTPAVIDADPVPINAGVELPQPQVVVKLPTKTLGIAEALRLPWSVGTDRESIMVDLGHGPISLLVVVPYDPATADVVARIVGLHNAALRG